MNAHPNKRVIGYSYVEQIRDILPSFILAFASGGISYVLAAFVSAPALLIVLQSLLMVISYLGLAWLFKVEEMSYLLRMLRGLRH